MCGAIIVLITCLHLVSSEDQCFRTTTECSQCDAACNVTIQQACSYNGLNIQCQTNDVCIYPNSIDLTCCPCTNNNPAGPWILAISFLLLLLAYFFVALYYKTHIIASPKVMGCVITLYVFLDLFTLQMGATGFISSSFVYALEYTFVHPINIITMLIAISMVVLVALTPWIRTRYATLFSTNKTTNIVCLIVCALLDVALLLCEAWIFVKVIGVAVPVFISYYLSGFTNILFVAIAITVSLLLLTCRFIFVFYTTIRSILYPENTDNTTPLLSAPINDIEPITEHEDANSDL